MYSTLGQTQVGDVLAKVTLVVQQVCYPRFLSIFALRASAPLPLLLMYLRSKAHYSECLVTEQLDNALNAREVAIVDAAAARTVRL